MPATHSTFTPSVSVTFPVDYLPTPVVLPAVDASNQAFVVSNSGPGTIAIAASLSAPGGTLFNVIGAVVIQAGSAKLLTGFSNITGAMMQASAPLKASVTVMRGSLADTWLFPNNTVTL